MSRLTLRIHSRGYEMDYRQRVSPGALARYCEQARWAALFEPSMGLAPLFEGGRKLVVRAQELFIGAPLHHDQELELAIWIAHVGKTSLRFAQEVTRVCDGVLAARSLVTAVSLDAQGKPAPVPQGVVHCFEQPDGAASASMPEAHAHGAWQIMWPVRPSDLDTFMHMNQSRYVDMVDDVRELCARAAGYGEASQLARGYPARIAVDYRRETRIGRDLRVTTWASAPRVLDFEVRDAVDGELVSRARIDVSE